MLSVVYSLILQKSILLFIRSVDTMRLIINKTSSCNCTSALTACGHVIPVLYEMRCPKERL